MILINTNSRRKEAVFKMIDFENCSILFYNSKYWMQIKLNPIQHYLLGRWKIREKTLRKIVKTDGCWAISTECSDHYDYGEEFRKMIFSKLKKIKNFFFLVLSFSNILLFCVNEANNGRYSAISVTQHSFTSVLTNNQSHVPFRHRRVHIAPRP